MDVIDLHILSPEGPLVQARVELVTLPGVMWRAGKRSSCPSGKALWR